MTPNPAPEPGQHVWIPAVAIHTPRGLAFSPLDADGEISDIEFHPGAYAWYPGARPPEPADVPPQPPVLAEVERLRAGIERVAAHCSRMFATLDPEQPGYAVGSLLATVAARLRTLADVPGPDDSTPEARHG